MGKEQVREEQIKQRSKKRLEREDLVLCLFVVNCLALLSGSLQVYKVEAWWVGFTSAAIMP